GTSTRSLVDSNGNGTRTIGDPTTVVDNDTVHDVSGVPVESNAAIASGRVIGTTMSSTPSPSTSEASGSSTAMPPSGFVNRIVPAGLYARSDEPYAPTIAIGPAAPSRNTSGASSPAPSVFGQPVRNGVVGSA